LKLQNADEQFVSGIVERKAFDPYAYARFTVKLCGNDIRSTKDNH